MSKHDPELLDCIVGLLMQAGVILSDDSVEQLPFSAYEQAVGILQEAGWIETVERPSFMGLRRTEGLRFNGEKWRERPSLTGTEDAKRKVLVTLVADGSSEVALDLTPEALQGILQLQSALREAAGEDILRPVLDIDDSPSPA